MLFHRLLPILVVALVGSANASPSAPDLFVREASLLELGGTRQLRVEGTFHYDDLVQVAYPFQLMVYTDSGHYVRYDLSGAAYTGVDAAIGDGIEPEEAAALLAAQGLEAGPKRGGNVVSLSPYAIELRLPDFLPAAELTVQIFVWDQGRIVFSNTRAVTRDQVR